MPCKCNPRPIPRPSPPLQWPSLPTIPIPSRHYNATPHRRLFQSPPAITMPAHCHRSIAAHCARSPSHYNALRYVPDVPRRRYNGPHQSIPSRSLTASRPAITMAPLGRRHCSLSPPLQCPPVRSRHPSPPLQWPSIINPFPLAYSVPSCHYNGTTRSPPLLALSTITMPSGTFPTSLAAVTMALNNQSLPARLQRPVPPLQWHRSVAAIARSLRHYKALLYVPDVPRRRYINQFPSLQHPFLPLQWHRSVPAIARSPCHYNAVHPPTLLPSLPLQCPIPLHSPTSPAITMALRCLSLQCQ
jgi:hypothetical protein